MSPTLNCEPWERVRILGRGGFGLVTLWKNKLSGELIAIKCLRENDLQGILKPKHKERWCNEVEMMRKLKNKNIVASREIPDELSSLQISVPLLAMEYCALGDLRQVLIKPENCCGLKESVILDILKDISNGLSYLHSCKVIHRDLKPDNIVLKSEDERIVYKLIDLGYAKELEHGSNCESFVGTIQYLAPELFMGKPYTCSVDYWSFGQVAHEIITGHRPFLPGLSPAVWMGEIEKKKRNVISVIQTWSGDTVHSSSLSKVNHLSSCLRQDFEEWLQLALDWDLRMRGRDVESKELTIFKVLNRILEKVTVRVFSMPTCEVLNYAINPNTSVGNLQSWICRDIGLEPDEQTLLLPNGKSLNTKGILISSLPPKRNMEEIALYLYAPGPIKLRSKPVLKPMFVKELLDEPKRMLEYPFLKRTCSDAVFVLQHERALYTNILSAMKTKIENIKQRTSAVESLLEDVLEELLRIEAYGQLFLSSLKTDMEQYVILRKSGVVSNNDLVRKWIERSSQMEKKLGELRKNINKDQQKIEFETAKKNVEDLINHPMMNTSKTPLDDLLAEGLILCDKVQKIPKDVRGLPMSNTDMVRVLLKATETSAKLLKSSELHDRFMKIFNSEDHLTKLISPLTLHLKSTKNMKQLVETIQKDRQKEVWGLINLKSETNNTKQTSEQVSTKPETSNSKQIMQVSVIPERKNSNQESLSLKPEIQGNSKFSPFHIPKTVHHDLVSPMDETLKTNFLVSGPVSISTLTRSLINHVPDEVDELIQCNNEWRYRTEDLTQSCQHMVTEINSLNWDFLGSS